MPRVNAQQARRILDRLVGYKISPLLWAKVRGGLSAGRVQSVAVRLIVDREREINAFVPREYWSITARLAKQQANGTPPVVFPAELFQIDGAKAEVDGREDGRRESSRRCADAQWRVVVGQGTRDAPQRRGAVHDLDHPTGSLAQAEVPRPQDDAAGSGALRGRRSRRPRARKVSSPTCAPTPPASPTRRARRRASSSRAATAKSSSARSASSRCARARQDAHEAIRPTRSFRTPDSVAGVLKRDELRLYRLIWERFVASQMAPARLRPDHRRHRVIGAASTFRT